MSAPPSETAPLEIRPSREPAEAHFDPADACAMVLFGASGDLARRMVVPALFRLVRRRLIKPGFRLIGYARTRMTDDEFRERMREACLEHSQAGDAEAWPEFAKALSYISAEDENDVPEFTLLDDMLDRFDREGATGGRRLFYLSLPPTVFLPTIRHLTERGLAGHLYDPPEGGWARVIVEKPFGRDLASARALNREIAELLDERDVYRIDHYLGKEAVQNLFAFRFANGLFEPLWNRNHIDNVQITAAETIGIEGRGAYYETAGALRDMVQNHLMQLLSLVALEPPGEWTPDAVRDEKVKVLRAIRTIAPGEAGRIAVRGQYGPGEVDGVPVPGYRDEEKVAPGSTVETFAALRLFIDNWRWSGVPFYLRSGKRLATRVTEIVVQFKPAPYSPFSERGKFVSVPPNTLTVRVTPNEGLMLGMLGKLPGHGMRLRPVVMDYFYADDAVKVETPTAYEHLVLDAMRGRATLFTRADEVEAAWEVVQPVLDAWQSEPPPSFPNYAPGSEGPPEAEAMASRSGRAWKLLCGDGGRSVV